MATPFHLLSLHIALCQLGLLHLAQGGVYYGHKGPPPQHQPLPQNNDGFPQQQFLGNEMPPMPLLPHYGKELPHLPLQIGKERPLPEGKGEAIHFLVFALI